MEKETFWDRAKTKWKGLNKKTKRNVILGVVVVVLIAVGTIRSALASDTAFIVEYQMQFDQKTMKFYGNNKFALRARKNDFEAWLNKDAVGLGLIGGDKTKMIAGAVHDHNGWNAYQRIELSPDGDESGGVIAITNVGKLDESADVSLSLGAGTFNRSSPLPEVIKPEPEPEKDCHKDHRPGGTKIHCHPPAR